MPAAFYHIAVRGIERSKILHSNDVRDSFLPRLVCVLGHTQTLCFTWSLISNHLHWLLRTGAITIG
jgi:hypothetical protein